MLTPSTSARIKRAIKAILTILVLAFVARHVARTWVDLRDRGQSLHLSWPWVALAVGLYLAGLSAFGLYFWRVLVASSAPAGMFPVLRAYLISHLGKYVPGKAMVVVMRVGLLLPCGTRPATATFASLYETLVMMAGGGFVAGLGFVVGSGPAAEFAVPLIGGRVIEAPLALLSLLLGLAFLVVVWPSVFPRLAGLASKPLRGVGPEALPRFSLGLLAEGLAWSVVGWLFLGLSLVVVIRGILPGGLSASLWASAVASVALATVAGFMVPIAPGGLGIREWALWTALGSAIDRDLAVVAALVLRLAWVVGELIVGGILLVTRPRLTGRESP